MLQYLVVALPAQPVDLTVRLVASENSCTTIRYMMRVGRPTGLPMSLIAASLVESTAKEIPQGRALAEG